MSYLDENDRIGLEEKMDGTEAEAAAELAEPAGEKAGMDSEPEDVGAGGQTTQDAEGPGPETVEEPPVKPARRRAAKKKAEGPPEDAPADGEDEAEADGRQPMDNAEQGEYAPDLRQEEDAALVGDESGEGPVQDVPSETEQPSAEGPEARAADGGDQDPQRKPNRRPRGRRKGAQEQEVGGRSEELPDSPLAGRKNLSDLDLNKLDRNLTEEEREEWNEIYASLRSRTVLTGRIIGIDSHYFHVKDRDTGRVEYREILCAVVITYRVKVLIPETEIWMPGMERPSHVLRGMSGAEIDYVILDVDREGGVAIASRKLGMAARQHFFNADKAGHKVGEHLTCRVVSVGPRLCMVECGGRDMTLKQEDLTYTATPDLRERYRPGQTLRCVLTEYDPYRKLMSISVKAATANPFQGAVRRHPVNSRRQATISGKYGGGVFCTLPDDSVCLCRYSPRQKDREFHVGDSVILVITQHNFERSMIYGRILSKW